MLNTLPVFAVRSLKSRLFLIQETSTFRNLSPDDFTVKVSIFKMPLQFSAAPFGSVGACGLYYRAACVSTPASQQDQACIINKRHDDPPLQGSRY